MDKRERWAFKFTHGRTCTLYGQNREECEREARKRARWHGWTDQLGRVRVLDSWRVPDGYTGPV